MGEPCVEGMPTVLARSFGAWGKPCSAPRHSPRAISASRAPASARSASGSCSETMALTAGFTASIRARQASITSRHETRRARSAAPSSTAVMSGMLAGRLARADDMEATVALTAVEIKRPRCVRPPPTLPWGRAPQGCPPASREEGVGHWPASSFAPQARTPREERRRRPAETSAAMGKACRRS